MKTFHFYMFVGKFCCFYFFYWAAVGFHPFGKKEKKEKRFFFDNFIVYLNGHMSVALTCPFPKVLSPYPLFVLKQFISELNFKAIVGCHVDGSQILWLLATQIATNERRLNMSVKRASRVVKWMRANWKNGKSRVV